MNSSKKVVKMVWTNGTFLHKPKSKLDSHIGLRETLAPKEEASKVSLWDMHMLKVHPKGLVGSGGQHEKS
jgi:hypothetical protein